MASSDVREMGNGRYEQKAAHAINQVLREPERLQSVREESEYSHPAAVGRWSPFNIVSGSSCEESRSAESFFARWCDRSFLAFTGEMIFAKPPLLRIGMRGRRREPARVHTYASLANCELSAKNCSERIIILNRAIPTALHRRKCARRIKYLENVSMASTRVEGNEATCALREKK